MKALIAILELVLPGFFTGNAKPAWKAVVAVAVIAAIVAWLWLSPAGCMTTTDLDGKVYSVRVDILTPIMPTTGPAATAYAPRLSTNHNPPARPTTAPARN